MPDNPMHVGTPEECEDIDGEWDEELDICWEWKTEEGGLTAPIHGLKIGYGSAEIDEMSTGEEAWAEIVETAGYPEDTEVLFEPDIGVLEVEASGETTFEENIWPEYRGYDDRFRPTPEEAAEEATWHAEQMIEAAKNTAGGEQVTSDLTMYEIRGRKVAAESREEAREKLQPGQRGFEEFPA